ncbi:GTP cyclohydrolase III (methanopterin) [Methanosarcina sp. MTP4]|nr:GTP cyclohydrolase III (methanopterin) [Methanosarcina sp. MTP4]
MKIISCEEPKSLDDVEKGFKGHLNFLNEISGNFSNPFLMFEIIEKLKVETQEYEISKKEIKEISFTNEEIEEWKRNSSKMIHEIRNFNELRDSPFIEDTELERMERELEKPIPDFMEKDTIIPFLLYILDLYHIFTCLPSLSILTENHAMNARYPDKDQDFDPLDFYLPGLPLIEEFPFLLDVANKILNKLEDIYYAEKADAWLDKGIILGNLGQHKKALRAVEKALEIDENYAEAWSHKGVILSELRRYKKAKKAAEKSLEIYPENIEAWYNLGIIYDEFGQYDESLAVFKKALNIAIDPNDENSWFIKSMIYSWLESYEEALKALDKVLEINQENIDALYKKIDVLYNLGREKEAEKVYKRTL